MADFTPNDEIGRKRIYSLQDIFETLAGTFTFEEVLDRILDACLRELEAEQGSILLLENESPSSLKMLAARGMPDEIVRRGYVSRSGSISEFVLKERRPLIIDEEPRREPYEALGRDTGGVPRRIYSAMCVPLLAGGRLLGTMNVNRVQNQAQFTQSDMETCSIIASQAAIVIENRRLQQELLHKERLAAVGQTVAGIGHCVKNMLAGVRGGLGLTEMGLREERNELVHEGFDLLKRHVRMLSNLVLDLLDYSKERMPIRDTFSIQDLFKNVVESVRHKAETLGVVIEVSAPENGTFFGDQDQLYRALLNLVTNATEACETYFRPGHVKTVSVSGRFAPTAEVGDPHSKRRASEYFVVTVRDNGPGIPIEAHPYIWDLFYSTKGSKGTGIGLAATRKMIEEHGGTIEMQTGPEFGTAFTIYLPVLTYDYEDSVAPV